MRCPIPHERFCANKAARTPCESAEMKQAKKRLSPCERLFRMFWQADAKAQKLFPKEALEPHPCMTMRLFMLSRARGQSRNRL